MKADPTVKTIVYDDKEFQEIRKGIFNENDPVRVVKQLYLYLLGIDVDDENLSDGEICPWEYQVSTEFMKEVMEYSFSLCKDKEHKIKVALIWLNYGPSSVSDLKPNEIRRVVQ